MKASVKWIEGMTLEGVANNHKVNIDLDPPAGKATGMSPGEMMGTAILGCKAISFASLAKKYDIDFESLELELEASSKKDGKIEGTHLNRKVYDTMHIIYKIKTSKTKEEMEEFLEIVNGLCIVGNSLHQDIKHSHEIIIL